MDLKITVLKTKAIVYTREVMYKLQQGSELAYFIRMMKMDEKNSWTLRCWWKDCR